MCLTIRSSGAEQDCQILGRRCLTEREIQSKTNQEPAELEAVGHVYIE